MFQKFEDYVAPEKKTTLSRILLFNHKQKPNKSIINDYFPAEILNLSHLCELGELSDSIVVTFLLVESIPVYITKSC